MRTLAGPDGQHLVIQAENGNSTHERYNHVAWGINQDLWIVGIDGTGAEKIYDNSASPNLAALHPHFSADGTRLIFAERIATGVGLGLDTPGGENPWAGWRIHVADDPGKRYLISDYDWDRTGRRIVLQVAPVDDATG